MLTPEQYKRMVELERDPPTVLSEDDKKLLPGLHFCPDWDHMLVINDCVEKASCTCK